MTEPLHEDREDRGGVLRPDGTLVRNLTPEEYDATYAEGEPCHSIPDDVLASAEADADAVMAELAPEPSEQMRPLDDDELAGLFPDADQ